MNAIPTQDAVALVVAALAGLGLRNGILHWMLNVGAVVGAGCFLAFIGKWQLDTAVAAALGSAFAGAIVLDFLQGTWHAIIRSVRQVAPYAFGLGLLWFLTSGMAPAEWRGILGTFLLITIMVMGIRIMFRGLSPGRRNRHR